VDWVVVPALEHQPVVVFGTAVRLLQPLARGFVDGLQNLLACESSPRLETVAEHFPESYTVCPDIRSRGKLEERNALRRTPSDWQLKHFSQRVKRKFHQLLNNL